MTDPISLAREDVERLLAGFCPVTDADADAEDRVRAALSAPPAEAPAPTEEIDMDNATVTLPFGAAVGIQSFLSVSLHDLFEARRQADAADRPDIDRDIRLAEEWLVAIGAAIRSAR